MPARAEKAAQFLAFISDLNRLRWGIRGMQDPRAY
jgi:hypothetical protein